MEELNYEAKKIVKTKGNFIVDNQTIAFNKFDKNRERVNSVDSRGCRSNLRDTWETVYNSELIIKEEILNVLPSINIDSLNDEINKTGAEYWSNGKSKAWTSKSLGTLLNYILKEDKFICYE